MHSSFAPRIHEGIARVLHSWCWKAPFRRLNFSNPNLIRVTVPGWNGSRVGEGLVVRIQDFAVQSRCILILKRKIPASANKQAGVHKHAQMCPKKLSLHWLNGKETEMRQLELPKAFHYSPFTSMISLILNTFSLASPQTKANRITPQLQTSHLEGTWGEGCFLASDGHPA